MSTVSGKNVKSKQGFTLQFIFVDNTTLYIDSQTNGENMDNRNEVKCVLK